MNRNLPNQITVGRVFLAAGFFVLLGLYQPGRAQGPWLLNAAFIIYIMAGLSDVLDGWIARKYRITSAFGRMIDPIVDKILVVGAFAMLAGANFGDTAGGAAAAGIPAVLTGGMLSAVQGWMVVLVAGREFIVSGLRGYSESRNIEFPATWAGKLKMFLQSFAICTVLFQLANLPEAQWAIWLKIAAVWLAVAVTVLSGLVYVRRAGALFRSSE